MAYPHQSGLQNGLSRASLDVDTALFELSSRMARAQLARQISNSSSLNRGRSGRIAKPDSTGGSPQHLQRRSSAASQRALRHRSEIVQQRTRWSQYDAGTAQPYSAQEDIRPLSWHPAATAQPSPLQPSLYPMVTSCSWQEQPLPTYQTVSYNGMPTPMVQPDLSNDIPIDSFYNLNDYAIPCQQTDGPTSEPMYLCSSGNGATAMYQQSQAYPNLYPYQFTNAYVPTSMDQMNPTQNWLNNQPPTLSYTAPPTPDFLPIQFPASGAASDVDIPPLPTKENKELRSLGLYDAPEQDNSSWLGGNAGMDLLQAKTGKGLKLEETWEPPEESEEEEEEEEEEEGGEDDAEGDAEDEETAQKAEVPGQQQTTTYDSAPNHSMDMSNQSFLFDHDGSVDAGMVYGFQQAPMMQQMPQLMPTSTYGWL
jgi:hypothetical protein